jgi:structural maintenance of chromosome 4
VARYEQERESAEYDFQEFQKGKREVEGEVAGLKKRIPEIEIQMEKIELDVQTGSKRVAEAEKRLAELQ